MVSLSGRLDHDVVAYRIRTGNGSKSLGIPEDSKKGKKGPRGIDEAPGILRDSKIARDSSDPEGFQKRESQGA